MGNQASVPKPGTKFQVIGAGLPRTGTASFSEALRILLQEPVYHGGTQATLAPPAEILSWVKLLEHYPPQNSSDEYVISKILRERFDGYAAVTDSPTCSLVKEMLEIHPDAMVIVTTRDPNRWVESMKTVENAATMWFLRFVLLPLPGMRHFPDYINGLRRQWIHNYGEAEPVTVKSYYGQIEKLKRIVPEKQLVFFDVKDGWGPLCKALGKDVPQNIPFPRINDGDAIDRLAKRMVLKGLQRYGVVFATLGVIAVSYLCLR
jgi:hypothetical protein